MPPFFHLATLIAQVAGQDAGVVEVIQFVTFDNAVRGIDSSIDVVALGTVKDDIIADRDTLARANLIDPIFIVAPAANYWLRWG